MNPEIFNLPNWEGLPCCEKCGIYMTSLSQSLGRPLRCVQCATAEDSGDDSILDADVIG
jgi:hypothetical protein